MTAFSPKSCHYLKQEVIELVYPEGWVTEVAWAPTVFILKTRCFYLRGLCNSCDLRNPNELQWRMMCIVYLGPRAPGRRAHPAWDSDPGFSDLSLSQNPLLLPCKSLELFSLMGVCIEVSGKYNARERAGMICAYGSFVSQLGACRPSVHVHDWVCVCIQHATWTCKFCMSYMHLMYW